MHGGQQPVAGAHVYLFGVRGDQNGVARSLLGTNGLGQAIPGVTFDNPAGYGTDALGTYVLTAADGSFTFNGSFNSANISGPYAYECAQNQLVYALAVGGNPGLTPGTNNTAISMMADLGPCMGTTAGSSTIVFINEVSTVAAAYALAGWMTGPTAIGYDNTAAGATGITNASANVNQLVGLSTGDALTTTPNGYGTPPTASLLTLANILAACVNSAGPTSTACSTLFANATSDGTASGTRPTETLTAALNIAHHPAANVASLFGIATATPAFAGGLAAQPHDFTLPIAFHPPASFLNSPGVPAVDSNGNIWFGSTKLFVTGYNIDQFSPLGAPLNAFALNAPTIQVAVDPSNNVWASQTSGGTVYKITDPYKTSYVYNGNSNDDGHQIALDASGNVFINDFTNGQIYELANTGSAIGYLSNQYDGDPRSHAGVTLLSSSSIATFSRDTSSADLVQIPLGADGDTNFSGPCGYGSCRSSFSLPTSLATDGNAHVWALNNNSTLSAVDTTGADNPNTGGGLPGSPFSGGGLNTTTVSPTQPYPWLAIDGSSNVWVANYTGSISQFSSTGTAITPSYASAAEPGGYYGVSPSCKGQGLAVDNAGNIWVSCDSSTTPFIEYIGAATPVYTPLLPGHFGARP